MPFAAPALSAANRPMLPAGFAGSPQEAQDQAARAAVEGRPGEAAILLEAALRGLPAEPQLRLSLARAQRAAGKFAAAVRSSRAAASQGAGAEAVFEVARAHLCLQQHREARRALDSLVDAARTSLPGLLLRGQVGLAARRAGEAERAFRQALLADPASAEAIAGLAQTQIVRGDVLGAARSVSRLRDGDNLALALVRAQLLTAMGRPAPAIERLSGLLRRPMPAFERFRALALLGEAYDAQGDLERAMEAWTSMNQQIGHRFDASGYLDRVERIEAWFHSAAAHALHRPVALNRPGPVFVVGAPGAGLGLVSALFAGHPKVHSLGESEELDRLMERIPAQMGSAMPECVSDLATLAPDSLQRSYDSAVGVLPEGRPFTVDASAQNLLHVGLIDLFFRSARVVLVERDPADLALQMFRRPWTAPGAAFAGSMADIQTYLSGHDRLVALWKSRVRRPIHAVRMEELVANPGTTVRRIVQAVGLPWSPATVEPLVSRGVFRSVGAGRRLRERSHQSAA
jgi:tetratricopeptide (TPR) repeat protein